MLDNKQHADLPLVIWCLTVQAFSFVFASESSLLSDASPGITQTRVDYNLFRLEKTIWETVPISLYSEANAPHKTGIKCYYICIPQKTGIIEMTGQLCFPDNTAAPSLIPMCLTSWCFALFISSDWRESIKKTDTNNSWFLPPACFSATLG